MNGMRVTVEMGQEEFIAFVNFQEERPKLLMEVKRLKNELHELAEVKDALHELAEEVNWAIDEENGTIHVNPKIAKELVKLAGRYLT